MSGPAPLEAPPADPLEQLYYVHDGSGVIGPVTGLKLKELIESGTIRPSFHLNRIGAPDWIPIFQIQPFSSFFRTGEAGDKIELAAEAAPHVYASFWLRLGAYALDNLFVALLGAVAGFLIALVGAAIYGTAASQEYLEQDKIIANLVGAAISLTYYIHFLTGPWQATPGKRILGIYVIRTDGERLTARIALFRNFSYIISAIPLFMGFLMVLWSDERKALHDIICGTRVVCGKL